MNIARETEEIEPSLMLYYSKLAEFMVQLIDIPEASVIFEPGCGHGALTASLLPLIKRYSKYICYDFYSGVYQESLGKIRKKKMKTIVVGDVREISLCSDSIDIIFSNELLCELTRNDAQRAINEFYRVLKNKGTLVHGVLSPYPENAAQELVILADTYSAEPIFPKQWFSPPADELAGMLHKAGFSRILVNYFEETIKFEGEAAFQMLHNWVTKPEFFEKYSENVRRHGLEYPMGQIVCSKKMNYKVGKDESYTL